MAKATYSAETKAAVLAALLAGQGVGQVAADFKLPEGTVKSWRSRMKNPDGSASAASATPEKRAEVGDLLVGYLHANLATLAKQLEVFGDPDWIRKQSASDMAVLHGVMTDKAIRLLEALGGAGNPPAE